MHTTKRSSALLALLLFGLAACAAPAPEAPAPRAPDPVGPVGEPVEADEEAEREAERERERERERQREEERRRAEREAELEAQREREAELERERAEREREERLRAGRTSRRSVPVLPGAVLPAERIVAFYGNPASTRMGILGELPPDEMLALLDREVAEWRRADPTRRVRPALHMIAVMATGDPGPDSLYRLRMPDRRIRQVMEWAERRDALVFIDLQVGLSSVEAELPRFEEWLRRPDVHLGLDPEWAMPGGAKPGTRIGTMSAREVNFAIQFLADLVERYDLPPKVLVVHRFTSGMLRDAESIRTDPRVQVVVNMDGWGPPSQKIHAYRDIVAPEATQFTGFKLFYRNDRRGGSRMMTPQEILELDPQPVYIQYQ